MSANGFDLIVVGGSAGALDALLAIVPSLPAGFPVPVAVVLHVPPGEPSLLPQVLGPKCALPVKEAEDKEPVATGTIYLAAPDYHLLVERRACFSLSVDDPVNFARPAIDALFESAAEAYGPTLVAVLLSGANQDGAQGLVRVKERGGMTLVQSPDSAIVPIMPAAGLQRTDVDHVLPPVEIGRLLSRLVIPQRVPGPTLGSDR
jgi:two-component system, chemotaxis family, protein-glutamate methylesterase/glutaminase